MPKEFNGAFVAVYTCSGCQGQFSATEGAHGDDQRFFCNRCWTADESLDEDSLRDDQFTRAFERLSSRWKINFSLEKSALTEQMPQDEALSYSSSSDLPQTVEAKENKAHGRIETSGNAIEKQPECTVGDLDSPHASQRMDAVQGSAGYPEPRDLFSDADGIVLPHDSAELPCLYEAASRNDFTTVEHLARNLMHMARNRDAKSIQEFALSSCVPSSFMCISAIPDASQEATSGAKSAEQQGQGSDAGARAQIDPIAKARVVSFAPFITSVSVGDNNGQLQVELVPSNLLCQAPSPHTEASAEVASDARHLLHLLEPLLAAASKPPSPPQPWSSGPVLSKDWPGNRFTRLHACCGAAYFLFTKALDGVVLDAASRCGSPVHVLTAV